MIRVTCIDLFDYEEQAYAMLARIVFVFGYTVKPHLHKQNA